MLIQSVIMLSVVIKSIVLSVIMLNVIMLNVIILNVVAPDKDTSHFENKKLTRGLCCKTFYGRN
jgi:hypothetical protein